LPEHKREAEDMVLGRRRLGIVEPLVVPNTVTLDLEAGDYDVAVPDLADMGVIGPHPDTTLPLDIADDVAGSLDPDGGIS
jgi:hypothetical protein